MKNEFMLNTYPIILKIMQKYCKDDNLIVRTSFNDLVHIIGENINDDMLGNEFRYVNFSNQIIISRVSFLDQRKGCFTEIMNYLQDEAKKNHIHQIVIQSVLSVSMANWCHKHNYNISSTFLDQPIFIENSKYVHGDYVKIL